MRDKYHPHMAITCRINVDEKFRKIIIVFILDSKVLQFFFSLRFPHGFILKCSLCEIRLFPAIHPMVDGFVLMFAIILVVAT